METSYSVSKFTIDNDFIEQWLDSLDPSVKTFATDFVINKLRRYAFDPQMIEDKGDKYFVHLLAHHFDAYLRLKFMDTCPGRLVEGWAVHSPS